MITSLPKSLIETAQSILTEAVSLAAHKEMANKASRSTKSGGLTMAEKISSHVIPLGKDTTVIPLERDHVAPHPEVEDHLDEHGYDVFDYKKGLAVKKGETKNPISIGKVLARTDAPQSLRTTYEKDPNRQGIDSSAKIVISRNPIHVAGMSTHQNWESCQTLGGGGKYIDEHGNEQTLDKQEIGSERKYVHHDIAQGSHIAYLVHHEDDVDKHYAPISRILLKPYTSEKGHTILRPSAPYGDEWGGFHDSVSKWAEHHFPMKDAEYKIHPDVYPEGKMKLNNYAPEHDEFWKQHGALSTHPSEHVIDHYISHLDDPIPGLSQDAQWRTNTHYQISDLAKNKNLKERHVMALMNHPATKFSTKEHLLAESPFRSVVDYGLKDKELHGRVSENPALTEHDISHIIHHNRGNLTSETPNKNILSNLGSHPNLSRSQADDLIHNTTLAEYPNSIGNAIVKASPEAAKHGLDKIQEDKDLTQYFKKDLGHIAKNRPELIPHMTNMSVYHAYNETKSPRLRKTLEDNMLSRGPNFHGIIARGSTNKESLEHVVKHSQDENAVIIAKRKLASM